MVFSLVFLSLFSCSTLSKHIPYFTDSHKNGSFSGVATLEQKSTKNHVNMEIFISGAHNLRIDVSISPWVPVFTLVETQKEMMALFFQKQEYYRGKNIKEALSFFFSVDLDSSILKEILFDRPPKGPGWKCNLAKMAQPVECKSSKWTIQWFKKGSSRRLVSLKNSQFNFTFLYTSFSSKVDASLFSLKIPKHFKKIIVK